MRNEEKREKCERISYDGGLMEHMPVESFCIKEHGVVLFGKCYHPKRNPHGCYPAVILCHEFASNMKSPERYAIPISALGYHVFVFDFTGSKGTKSYGREDIDASVFTDKEEMNMVYQYARQQSYVDKQHIILGGCSQGGFTAGLLAADYAEEIEAVLMYYPALCAPDYLRRGYMMGVQFDVENVPEYIEMYRGTGIGRKYVADVTSLDPWKELTVFKKPVLICHGTGDSIADISYSEEAVRQYNDCTLFKIESGEHIFKEKRNFEKAVDATIHFLQDRIMSCNERKRMI